MTDPQHPSADLLVDVVLGHALPDATSQVSRHLSECRSCRTAYDELNDALESVLPAASEATVPAGFESRVLEQLRLPEVSSPAAKSLPPRRRSRHLMAAAAACALGIVIGATGVYTYQLLEPDDAAPPAASEDGAAELTTMGGETVGWAATGYDAEGPVLVLTVDGGTAGATYTCRGVFDDHTTEVLAEWTVYEDQTNLWVLEDTEEPLKALELVDDSGQVWAQAEW